MEENVKIQFESTKEYLKLLEEAVEQKNHAFIESSLDGVNPADISEVLSEFEADEAKYIIDILPVDTRARIISDLDEDIRTRFLKSFNSSEVAALLNYVDSDDAADIIADLDVKTREEIIAEITNEEKAANIVELLRYEEDCAGGLMAKELIKANYNWTVQHCIEEIRRKAEIVQKVYSVYVVDDTGKLKGRVALKKILLSDDNTNISEIYEEEVISVITYFSKEEVASVMRKYDLESVPVVNVQGRLLGRITIDDIVDVITEQQEEERQLMAGISEDVEEDDSIWVLSRARLPWLVIGLVGELLGARVIGTFESDIIQITAIAFFIPLITATGGNVGIQSSTLVVQSLANPSSFAQSIMKKMFKTVLVALVNGVLLGLLVSGLVWLINHDMQLAFVVSVALFSVVILASIFGTLVPLIMDRLKINPALASGPFITTCNDILGLLVYFTVAHLMYKF